jgi:hypothetical protein
MSQQNVKKDNFYFMKLKKNISKAGKAYYKGQFAYAIDLLGFEKEDGSITLWLAPQDMDKMKQQGQQQYQKPQQTPQAQYQRPVASPPKQQYVDHTQGPEAPPWPDTDDIPF